MGILALFGFLVTAWCFPEPEPCFPFCGSTQNCQTSQCNQNNGPGVGGDQNCQGSQCNQNNLGSGGGGSGGGGSGGGGSGGGGSGGSGSVGGSNFPATLFGDFFTQNCQTSQCAQNNAGRKKRASVQVRPGKTLFYF